MNTELHSTEYNRDIHKYSSPGNHSFKSHYRRQSRWFICGADTQTPGLSPLITLWGFGLWVCCSNVWFIRLMPWEWTSLRHPSCYSSSNLLCNLLVNTLAKFLWFFTPLEWNRESHLNLAQWHQPVCVKSLTESRQTGSADSGDWNNLHELRKHRSTGCGCGMYRLHSGPLWPGRDTCKCCKHFTFVVNYVS